MIQKKTKKKIKVFVVGDGMEKERLIESTKDFSEMENVELIFTSWIENIAEFNAGMDIIGLTSINEGTPVSLIEAQASGVAVITTDVGGVRTVVLDGVTGFVVASNDTKTYADRLLDLIENDNKRLEMSQKGWIHVKDKFNYHSLVNNMEIFYRELLEKRTTKCLK